MGSLRAVLRVMVVCLCCAFPPGWAVPTRMDRAGQVAQARSCAGLGAAGTGQADPVGGGGGPLWDAGQMGESWAVTRRVGGQNAHQNAHRWVG